MYNPDLGTFVQRDPIEADENLYRYAGDSPTNRIDPMGLSFDLAKTIQALNSGDYWTREYASRVIVANFPSPYDTTASAAYLDKLASSYFNTTTTLTQRALIKWDLNTLWPQFITSQQFVGHGQAVCEAQPLGPVPPILDAHSGALVDPDEVIAARKALDGALSQVYDEIGSRLSSLGKNIAQYEGISAKSISAAVEAVKLGWQQREDLGSQIWRPLQKLTYRHPCEALLVRVTVVWSGLTPQITGGEIGGEYRIFVNRGSDSLPALGELLGQGAIQLK